MRRVSVRLAGVFRVRLSVRAILMRLHDHQGGRASWRKKVQTRQEARQDTPITRCCGCAESSAAWTPRLRDHREKRDYLMLRALLRVYLFCVPSADETTVRRHRRHDHDDPKSSHVGVSSQRCAGTADIQVTGITSLILPVRRYSALDDMRASWRTGSPLSSDPRTAVLCIVRLERRATPRGSSSALAQQQV